MIDWKAYRSGGESCEPPRPEVQEIMRLADAYLQTPEGRAEVEAFAAELRDDAKGCVSILLDRTCGGDLSAGRREVIEIAQLLLKESEKMEPEQATTEGITIDDVNAAMAELGIHNPKPGIPLETTVSGHEIVALARKIRGLERSVSALHETLIAAGYGHLMPS